MAATHPPIPTLSQASLALDGPPIKPTLADVLPLMYNEQWVPKHDIRNLRLTSKKVKAAVDPKAKKISVGAYDVDALAKCSFNCFISKACLKLPKDCEDIYGSIAKFCTHVSLPNLETLFILKIDLVSMPLLGQAQWPKLKKLQIHGVVISGSVSTSPSFLQTWKTAGWPLEELEVSFDTKDGGAFPAVAYTLSAFPQLKSLILSRADSTVATAIAAANLAKLETLDLYPTKGEWPGIAEALTSGNWPKLRSLSLPGVNLMLADNISLIQASWFSQLKRINLMSTSLSTKGARALFRSLHGGPIETIYIDCPPNALLEFSGLSLPHLTSLWVDLFTTEPQLIDAPMDALARAKLPKLSMMRVFSRGEKLSWQTPMDLDSRHYRESFLVSVNTFVLSLHSISSSVFTFLGRHLLSRDGVRFMALHPAVTDSADPISDLLSQVPERAKVKEPSFGSLDCPIMASSIPTLFDQFSSKLSHIYSFTGRSTDVEGRPSTSQSWKALVDGTWVKEAQGSGNRQEIRFSLELGVEAVFRFIQASLGSVFVSSIQFLKLASNADEELARDVLIQAFPDAAVQGGGSA